MIFSFSSLSFLVRHEPGWLAWPFGPGMTGGWLLTLSKFVFIGLVLALIIWLLRWAFGPGGPFRDKEFDDESDRTSRNEALDILRKRFAQGEISLEEYEMRRRALEK
jgi:uncharacterized membrane protein